MDLTKKSGAGGAFTLIELLVVITIIAILMALLFPAFKGVQDQAKRTQAKNDMTQIVTAVNAYYTEYGKMPVDDTKQGFDTLVGDPGGSYDNAFIFNILRAIADTNWNAGNKYNPKQITFFNGADAKSATASALRVRATGCDGKWSSDQKGGFGGSLGRRVFGQRGSQLR